MGYVTINTDVDVYLDDFSDDEIFEEAYERLREFKTLNKIRDRDQAWLDKFARLFTGLPDTEYQPSQAYHIKSQEELRNLAGYTFGE